MPMANVKEFLVKAGLEKAWAVYNKPEKTLWTAKMIHTLVARLIAAGSLGAGEMAFLGRLVNRIVWPAGYVPVAA